MTTSPARRQRLLLPTFCALSATLVACATHLPAVPPPPPAALADAPETSEADFATKPIAEPVLVQTPVAQAGQGNYAQREDTALLATRLAGEFELDPTWVRATLDQARFKESVTRFIMPAAKGTAKNWTVYRSRFIDAARIKAGVAFWRQYDSDLRRAEARWGVPASIIVGVIGVETIYGRNTGNFRLLDALATLSLDFPSGRSDRSAFFQNELGQFLKLCQEQDMDPTQVLGSYAGALGLPQFMPSSVRQFAVDFDGDGHIDLQRSPVDAIGSVARYLAEHGWQKNMPTHYDIQPPADADSLAKLLASDIVPSFTVAELQELGASLSANGQNHSGLLALVKLENGNKPPLYIAGTDNFFSVTRYNQSSYYALAVIQLGQAVAREAGIAP